jgi:hypothetical protein
MFFPNKKSDYLCIKINVLYIGKMPNLNVNYFLNEIIHLYILKKFVLISFVL